METKYKLVIANGSSTLSSQVNLLLKSGWVLYGDHQVTHYVTESKDDQGDTVFSDKFQYSQTLVKYAEQQKD